MNYPNKINLDVAAVRPNKFDLSHQCIMTNDFGSLLPCMVRSTIPNESYRNKIDCFLRTAPMALPTFGRVDIGFDTFFVRYDQLFAGFQSMMQGKQFPNSASTMSEIVNFPYFTAREFFYTVFLDGIPSPFSIGMLSAGTFGTQVRADNIPQGTTFETFRLGDVYHYFEDQGTAVDIIYGIDWDPQNGVNYAFGLKLNRRGKVIYSILNSLGYQLNGDWDFTPSGLNDYNLSNTKLNAMRLLAYLKVFYDWYLPAQWCDYSAFDDLLERVKHQNIGTDISPKLLNVFKSNFVKAYDADLFTASWITPNGVIAGGSQSLSSSVFTPKINDSSVGDSLKLDTSGVQIKAPTTREISVFGLHLAERFQSFISRFRVGGRRDVDRYMTQFGVKSKEVESNRSVLVNHYQQILQISDVMATNENELIDLGQYAGKGLSYGENSWSYHTEDYGVLLTINYIMPRIGYPTGIDRNNLIIAPSDMYQPEFDGVGVEAIPFMQMNGGDTLPYYSGQNYGASVFGYVPRFSSLKTQQDILSGDFRVHSRNIGLDAFHLFRDMRQQFANNINFRQLWLGSATRFGQASDSGENFDRIFTDMNTEDDHFFLFINNNLTSLSPMKSISDMYEITHVDDGEQHNRVTVDLNGHTL